MIRDLRKKYYSKRIEENKDDVKDERYLENFEAINEQGHVLIQLLMKIKQLLIKINA